MVTHTIDTGNKKLIKNNCYRYSFDERKEMKKKIEEMINKGTMESSSGPHSPFLLRRKTVHYVYVWITVRLMPLQKKMCTHYLELMIL